MKTINYKGAIIEPSEFEKGFTWAHPDYEDHDYRGDGMWSHYGCGSGATIEDCKEEIDEFLAEIEEKAT